MKIINKNAIITIKSGKSCAISPLVFDIPEEKLDNEALKGILNKDVVILDVDEIECFVIKKDNIVAIACNVENEENMVVTLAYKVKPNDHFLVSSIFKNNSKIKNARDESKAILAVKKILDSYDPFIQVSVKDEEETE